MLRYYVRKYKICGFWSLNVFIRHLLDASEGEPRLFTEKNYTKYSCKYVYGYEPFCYNGKCPVLRCPGMSWIILKKIFKI